ncbi:nitroreductase family protein [Sodaliphilus pleomorphus]|jgi:nitroreductase|uniref:Diguanylate cyclase n=1 Tax=Sodaliphilus pleomorphus TaxID=2606626 RepID=A0A6L5XFI4_9BACT|nr:nitroreductase [Sodaliphilus pleomorphus]MSS18251.1 diguanylate cyclase [Sodaliphilus pleomorphus]
MNNEIINALLTRRSVRSYKPQQVTDDELRTVLETGTYAPTSMGRQDPWIVAVQNAGLRQELTEMNAKVMGVDSDPYYGAPTIVLVFATKGARNAVQDASLALGNMMNAAHAIGLGSCWINRELEMFDTPLGRSIMQRLGLPEGLTCVGALSLGYIDKQPAAPKPRKANYYRVVK